MLRGTFGTAAVAGLVAGLLVTGAAPASAACGFSGSGDGSSSDPYLISSETDLQCLHDRTNGEAGETASDFTGLHFRLTQSISWTGAAWTTGIGIDAATDFAGTFDGGLNTISGLNIVGGSNQRVGLFGHLGSSGVVRNVGFEGNVSASQNVGGLVGYNQGTVSNSHATGTVVGTSNYVGGLVGFNNGTISSSYATGEVDGASYVGGLVGYNNTAVSNSFATGAVDSTSNYVGGLVGFKGSIQDSYATGRVQNGDTTKTTAGGVIGASPTTVTNTFWDVETSGQTPASGHGRFTGDSSYGKTTSEMKTLTTFSAWSIADGWSADATTTPWGMCSAVNSGYPFLNAFYTSDPCSGGGGGGSADSSGTAPATYTFSFRASTGGTCLPDVTVTRGQSFTLPPASVSCTPEGTMLVGWAVPGQIGHFSPAGRVVVSADQVFTAVPMNPSIKVTYDANVDMATPCLAGGINVETEDPGRWVTVTVDRLDASTLAASAPCAPDGFRLIGWTDAPTLEGSGQAYGSAATFEVGAEIPAAWNVVGSDPVNAIHLYALWGQASA